MDDPNITIEEYIRLEEENARKRAIAFNDEVSSEKTLSCEPTVSSLNDEIDFRVSFDDFDDEDYKPAMSYFDDLDFFKDFENEFPAIVYNDAQTSKSNLLTEPILNPQHIDKFDLNDETSLFEYDKEEQNVLYFNDLFPFNIIHPNDLKSEKDNDDMAPLPPREQRHPFLRYQGLEYTHADIANFKDSTVMMPGLYYSLVEIGGGYLILGDHWFGSSNRNDAGVVVFTSRAWGRLFETRGPLVWELILEFLSTLRFGKVLLDLDAPDTIQF
ncbi:hypothetical protein Tco_0651730 [Tanacetum coccineum]|uniref:Uncharacterized protein n=1 Tax=Tanacetum coccineum TaxID=301880 RepID=A0ABQ4WVM6_9ASTR